MNTSLLTQVSKSQLSFLTTSLFDHDIVVFSHLRWEFVTQRPQHILQRLSKNQRVIFIEEPIESLPIQYGQVKTRVLNPNLIVIQPKMKMEEYPRLLTPMLKKLLKAKKTHPILWFYTPAFVQMAERIDSSLIVFDCMDELKAFKGASATLLQQEKQLLNMADVVFTGGKSLYEAKAQLHDNAHCFPSSVDRAHFEKALDTQTLIPDDVKSLSKPRVGFYGVLDERLDLDLISETAALMPEVDFVFIGPVVKINPNDLPTAENLHYLGQRSYEVLPNYLKSFNVAFMPFALNEATAFISPTKTLEFMAAHKPIVSTAIYDVKRDYSREVSVVSSAREAATAIDALLHESPAQKEHRLQLQAAVIKRTSWDKTVASMAELMQVALDKKAHQADFVTSYYDQTLTMPFSLSQESSL